VRSLEWPGRHIGTSLTSRTSWGIYSLWASVLSGTCMYACNSHIFLHLHTRIHSVYNRNLNTTTCFIKLPIILSKVFFAKISKQLSIYDFLALFYRWVCTSGDPGDLDTTDEIVTSVLEDFINKGGQYLKKNTDIHY
jgi:hypothetical protein